MCNCFLRDYPNLYNHKWNVTFPIFLVCVAVLDSININSSIQTEAKGNFSTTFSKTDFYQRNLTLLWQTSTGGFTACLNASRNGNWGKLGPWLVTTDISSDWIMNIMYFINSLWWTKKSRLCVQRSTQAVALSSKLKICKM